MKSILKGYHTTKSTKGFRKRSRVDSVTRCFGRALSILSYDVLRAFRVLRGENNGL